MRWFHIDLNRTAFYEAGVMITMWIFANKIEGLTVVGPSVSKHPVIYERKGVFIPDKFIRFSNPAIIFSLY